MLQPLSQDLAARTRLDSATPNYGLPCLFLLYFNVSGDDPDPEVWREWILKAPSDALKIFFSRPSSDTGPYIARNVSRSVSYLSESDEGYESRTDSPENIVKDENMIKEERTIKEEPRIKEECNKLAGIERAMQRDNRQSWEEIKRQRTLLSLTILTSSSVGSWLCICNYLLTTTPKREGLDVSALVFQNSVLVS
jgi:hypothetical protein